MTAEDARRWIRHPVDVPIACQVTGGPAPAARAVRDVSEGGLSFHTAGPLAPGSRVRITIDLVRPPFTATAVVAWCRPEGDGWLVGVGFEAEDVGYRARMVEQLCHIEQYRRRVREEEGRELSAQEAALEWIARHARDFPR